MDDDPLKESRLLKQEDVRLIPVGISQYVDEAQLKEMASVPAEYSYIYASDFSHLNLLVDQLLSRLICSNPPPAQRKSLVLNTQPPLVQWSLSEPNTCMSKYLFFGT